MHYDSKHTKKSARRDIDLFERDTRIQSPPAAQVHLPVPLYLAGHDPLRVLREGYEWEHR